MSRKGWLLFGALCVIWGIPYLFIRVAVRDFSPPALVFFRTTPAALLLLPLAARGGHLRPVLAHWRWVLVFAVVELAVPWLLLARAEQHISSSLAGLLIATVPLMGAVIYSFVPGMERLDARRLVGLVVGFAGVAALVGIDLGHLDLVAVAEVIVTAFGYALGPLVISRRLADLHGLGVTSVAVAITAIAYAPFALTDLPQNPSSDAIVAVAVLALVCTALAFLIFFDLILEAGPSRATVITYINPLVAVLLGVVVLSEPFTVGIAVGLPLILAGSVLATRRSEEPTESPQATESPPTESPQATESASPPASLETEQSGPGDARTGDSMPA